MSRQIDKLAQILGIPIRTSLSGVSHIVYDVDYMQISICYFGKSKTFRMFYPYPSDEQTRIDCFTVEQVLDSINKLEKGKQKND